MVLILLYGVSYINTVVGTPRFMNLIAALKEYTSIPVIFTSLFILRGKRKILTFDL